MSLVFNELLEYINVCVAVSVDTDDSAGWVHNLIAKFIIVNFIFNLFPNPYVKQNL